ncbi:hypothetical protein HBI18_090600 [Parastagonospora nodorum]|nr:hypothetical protein HBI78_123980 [Parastagonospora nodorum]KAH5731600.1 hypothetical protein HBI18_090600 [Parastagonospora nodorum]
MPARSRKESTSNRMNISMTLIKLPVSKLEIYKLDDMLAHYRSLTACSNLHLLARTVAEETHVWSLHTTAGTLTTAALWAREHGEGTSHLQQWFTRPCSGERPSYRGIRRLQTSSRANRFLRNSKVHTANITTQASTERCHSLPYRLRYGMVWALEQRTMLFRQLHGETFRLLAPCDLEMDMNKPSATA